MRIFSHTCSNTEIVCALGCAELLVGVDTDSDYPPEVVAQLPKLGRDLNLDVDAVKQLAPDLVLTSLTVPGHEKVVQELQATGMQILVCDPLSLADVYADIARIAEALNVSERGAQLIGDMQASMPQVTSSATRPTVLVEWWPKPIIAPAKQSWATDIIRLAGGHNPWGEIDAKSQPMEQEEALAANPELIVMSWCGVKEDKYRPEVVSGRPGWQQVSAVATHQIHAISEAYLGRPGPRLVEGYRRLRELIAAYRA